MNLGAIDIGSNAIRLLIARIIIKDDSIVIKKSCLTRVPIRLGEDTFGNNNISDKKIEKLTKAISSFKTIMELYEVKDFKTIATSALREAENHKKVINYVFNKTDVKIALINGDEEASIISNNLENIDDFHQKNFLHVDVGGGSTEVNLIFKGKHLLSKSFKIGSVRNLKNKDNKETWKELEKHLDKIKKEIKQTEIEGIGTGGNINKCLKIINNNISNERKVSTKQLNTLYDNLKVLSEKQRILNYQLKDDRADVIVPAIKIYNTIFNSMKIKTVNIPKVGLADGIILNLYKKIKS
jgi:exopolyphosphatase / guanosine-5'-triphosphate,3'-diphosphate pyrophosphatase